MVDHINSGKRTQRLRHRHARSVDPFVDLSGDDEEAA
jgi:hypothetical protein